MAAPARYSIRDTTSPSLGKLGQALGLCFRQLDILVDQSSHQHRRYGGSFLWASKSPNNDEAQDAHAALLMCPQPS